MYMHAPNQERQTTPVVQSSSTRPDLAGGRSGGQTCNEYAAGELGSATLIATVLVQIAAVSDRPAGWVFSFFDVGVLLVWPFPTY
jgi:hypothetical protein